MSFDMGIDQSYVVCLVVCIYCYILYICIYCIYWQSYVYIVAILQCGSVYDFHDSNRQYVRVGVGRVSYHPANNALILVTISHMLMLTLLTSQCRQYSYQDYRVLMNYHICHKHSSKLTVFKSLSLNDN